MVSNASRDVPISPAWKFDQRLLNFNQYFVSDSDYLFTAMSVYEQHHLRKSINVTTDKIKTGYPQQEQLKIILNELLKVFLQLTTHFRL